MKETTSVLICTFRRREQLRLLLGDMARQTLQPDELVVVDNDAAGSARDVVEPFAREVPFTVRYEVQPKQGISLTRNRTIELSSGDWLGGLDDDERVTPDWLQQMTECARRFGADGVLGPLVYELPADAPAWVRQNKVFTRPRHSTGTRVPSNELWTANTLLRAASVRAQPVLFDEALGLSGGEDAEFLLRLERSGARFVWCDEAVASEPVPPARTKLRWILVRSYSGGQIYARSWSAGHFGTRRWYSWPAFALKACAAVGVATTMALLTLPARGHSVNWLCKASSNAGKLTALVGGRYQRYAVSMPQDSAAPGSG
ncbi:MAG: glycosyltransferase family 2 protein [Panacagrimonas sp.]